jgi:hypothetical protein
VAFVFQQALFLPTHSISYDNIRQRTTTQPAPRRRPCAGVTESDLSHISRLRCSLAVAPLLVVRLSQEHKVHRSRFRLNGHTVPVRCIAHSTVPALDNALARADSCPGMSVRTLSTLFTISTGQYMTLLPFTVLSTTPALCVDTCICTGLSKAVISCNAFRGRCAPFPCISLPSARTW